MLDRASGARGPLLLLGAAIIVLVAAAAYGEIRNETSHLTAGKVRSIVEDLPPRAVIDEQRSGDDQVAGELINASGLRVGFTVVLYPGGTDKNGATPFTLRDDSVHLANRDGGLKARYKMILMLEQALDDAVGQRFEP